MPRNPGGDTGKGNVDAATSGQGPAPGPSEPGNTSVLPGSTRLGADASTTLGSVDASADQDSSTPACVVGPETCDGKDNDCDGKSDEDGVCAPPAPFYTCPPGACAEWPMPDRVPGAKVSPSYSVGADAVTDEVTKLVWQRQMPAQPTGCTSTGGGCTWEEAVAYCDNLALAGTSDWRLPSKIELESLVDDTVGGMFVYAIDAAFASAKDSWRVWTSSPVSFATGAYWTIEFADGMTFATLANNTEYKLPRCVRGGVRATGSRYSIVGEVVVDNWTRLQWQRKADLALMGWQSAIAYCPTLGQGFRLPTKKEMLTLFDSSRSGIPMDLEVFPDAAQVPNDQHGYWSSTLIDSQSNGGTVAFVVCPASSGDSTTAYGGNYVTAVDGNLPIARVRCVR